MAKLKLRIPADLVVDLDLGDPVVRVPHWRTWPNEIPKTGVVVLMRVELFGIYYYVAGYLDGVDFVDSAGHPVFRDDPDDEDTVFERRTPDEFQWIPLGELLESVEDPDKSEEG